MTGSVLVAACAALVLASGDVSDADSSAPREDADEVSRTSEAVIDPDEQWRSPGLRVNLAAGYTFLAGGPSVDMVHSFDVAVHLGWRFSSRWEAIAAFRYGFLLDGLSGVRWTATLEPVFHLDNGLWFSVGAGYGGIWGGIPGFNYYNYRAALEDPDRIDLDRGDDQLEIPPFVNCNGDGIAAVGRVGFTMVAGDLFATGPMLELEGQWTLCSDQEFNTWIPEDADIQVPKQWWSYFTVGFSWVLSWR